MKLTVVNEMARAALRAGALAGAALLAACGGGSSNNNNFVAQRVIAFGDEFSVITPAQKKYSVNALLLGSSSAVDCSSNLLWIQSLAAIYGLVFPQCAGDVADPPSRIWAANGALVADLSAQVDQQLNEGGFGANDLVTVLVGANDVVAQFAQYPAIGEDQLLANLQAAGTELANQVNRLAGLGAKVLVSTVPDMGKTPFAGDRSAGSTDSNPALLTRLTTRFNDALLANLINDGHKIGLLQLDEFLLATDTATLAGTGTFQNSTLPACFVALPNCTTNTIVADATTSNYLWADSRHLGALGQSSLGSLAITRARNNPF